MTVKHLVESRSLPQWLLRAQARSVLVRLNDHQRLRKMLLGQEQIVPLRYWFWAPRQSLARSGQAAACCPWHNSTTFAFVGRFDRTLDTRSPSRETRRVGRQRVRSRKRSHNSPRALCPR
jgi:hypothetical protein